MSASDNTQGTADTRPALLVIVLGVHRSGTSALTSGLQALGVELGDNLLPGVAGNNAKGFFEDIDVYGLNRELLEALDSAWDALDPIAVDAFAAVELEPLRERARTLLVAKTRRALTGIKDPVFCRVLPFWQPLFRELRLEVRYLLAVRDPLDVARSLRARDGKALAQGAALYVANLLPALRSIWSDAVLFVAYDALVEQPRAQLARVADFLGLRPECLQAPAVHDYLTRFLDRDLRHHDARSAPVADQAVPPIAAEAFAFACALAEGARDGAALDSLERRFAELLGFHAGLGEESRALVPVEPTEPAPVVSEVVVYFAGTNQSFAEMRTQRATVVIGGGPQRLVFAVPRGTERLRLDPALHACVIRLGHMTLRRADGGACPGALDVRDCVDLVERPADGAGTRVFISIDDDPQCELGLPPEARARLCDEALGLEIDIELLALAAAAPFTADDVLGLARTVDASAREVREALEQMDARRRAEVEQAHTESARANAAAAGLRVELQLAAVDLSDTREQLATLRQGMATLESDRLAVRAHREDLLRLVQSQQTDLAATVEARDSLRATVDQLMGSTSWRATAPLRAASRAVSRARHAASAGARALYRALPIGTAAKVHAKSLLFRALPVLFDRTQAYRDWQRHTGYVVAPPVKPIAHDAAPPSAPRSAIATVHDSSFVAEPRALPPTSTRVTLVAFYLPQFHPCPENDLWWGRGFTEWTNVSRALPQFEGHYQPHLPGELGFYDLRVPEVMQRQVALAQNYGIGAFCFYFYWFAGKTLLETPLRHYLASAELSLPFCLCWANENWSRRWDGLDSDVLIAQQHSPEDDLAFIEHIQPWLEDPRYLRVDGKPVLLVYRPSLLPEARATAQRWRDWAHAQGLPGLFLVYPQSFDAVDPAQYGFDAATEFPPNLSGVPTLNDTLVLRNPDYSGPVYDWRALVERSERYPAPDYTLFRAVCPSWDNESRRLGRGAVFLHSNPADYRRWLGNAIDDTCGRFAARDRRLVFVNAWNEWAEGAHLEPDQRYGYAWLEATRAAVAPEGESQRRIVVVTHDAHPHGAQYLALHLVQGFARDLGFTVATVCLGEGVLAPRFAEYGPFHDLCGREPGYDGIALADRLWAEGYRAAILNTTVSGSLAPAFAAAGIRCLSLVHELGGVLRDFELAPQAAAIARHAQAVVFAAPRVRDEFLAQTPVTPARVHVRPQGLYKRNRFARDSIAENRARLRALLDVPADAVVVLGAGYADRRKGIDLFVDAALRAAPACERLHFVWIGHWCGEREAEVGARLAAAGPLAARFHFPGRVDDTDPYYAGADLYALSSREDPYPTVVMEAMDAGLPVVAFEGGGGFEQLLRETANLLVPMADTEALASVFLRTATAPDALADARTRGPLLVDARFAFRDYLFDLAEWSGQALARVSVVVPNYNYARFLGARLDSIAAQTHPFYELIVLDDASTDASVHAVEAWRAATGTVITLEHNASNSGNVFAQWLRGVERARGDFVWIAEADDLADPEFLATVLDAFADPDVVLSYCESRQMGPDGAILAKDYRDYVADISPTRWAESFVHDGISEIRESLCIKNTIPNASAVVFRREALLRVLNAEQGALSGLRVAGDWLVYARLLASGKLAYTPRALNSHRRHAGSVTLSRFDLSQLEEIVALQDEFAATYDAPASSRALAEAYSQSLYEQFGLATPQVRSFRALLSSPSANHEPIEVDR